MELGSRASGQAGGLDWRQGLKGPGLRGQAFPARFLPAQTTRQCRGLTLCTYSVAGSILTPLHIVAHLILTRTPQVGTISTSIL